MVSKEPSHLPTVHSHSNGNPDKTPTTVTVRSVLLNRNSPDIESRLKRRRSRTQQVRFKDLEDEESLHKNDKVRSKSPTEVAEWQKEMKNGPSLVGAVRGDMEKTIGAVTAFLKRAPPHPLTPGPTRRSWVPTDPYSVTLPLPSQPCRSTAIQTSPSLQKPSSLSNMQLRSHSLVHGPGEDWQDQYSSDDMTTQVTISPEASQKRLVQNCTPDEQSGCQNSKDNQSASLGTATQTQPGYHASQKQCRRRGRRRCFNRAASDPGKPEPTSTSPSESVPKSPPESVSLKKLEPHRNSLSDIVLSQCSSVSNEPPNAPFAVHSTPIDLSIEKSLATPEHTGVASAEIDSASCSHPTNTTNGVSVCATENISVSSTVSEPLCTTTAGVVTTAANFSTNNPLCKTPTKSMGHCCTPTFSNMTNNKAPSVTGSESISNSHLEQMSPAQCTPCCSVPEETASCTSSADQTRTLCSPVVPQRQKTAPAQAMACENSSNRPVISRTQSATPLPTVPGCRTLRQNETFGRSSPLHAPFSIPNAQTVQTSTAQTPKPVQPVCFKVPVQPVPYSVKDKPGPLDSPTLTMSFHKVPTQTFPQSTTAFSSEPVCAPQGVAPFKGQIGAGVHIFPMAQTAVHCIVEPTSVGTNVTPSVPVLICNPSTQQVQGKLSVQMLANCNSRLQSLVSHCHQNQTGQSFKAPSQSVPQSKSFPQNMSPLLSTHEAGMYPNKAQDPVVPPSNFRHSLPPYAFPPQTAVLYTTTGASASPPQAFCSSQVRRDRRELPPPPPPPPPYTPRKEVSSTPAPPCKPPGSAGEPKNKDKNKGKTTGVAKPIAESAIHQQRGDIPPPVPPKTKARATVKPTCLRSRRAILGTEAQLNVKHLPPSAGMTPQTSLGPADGQADTLRQVQELLGGLMSGAKCKLDLAKAKEKLFGPNGPLYDIGTLQSQLHSLEGVLETSQNTIKVLLDVIQDLEKKEAERDGRHWHGTGQDIENCGACRDCACIIYSVEHDFRQQEGQVTKTWKVPEHQECEQTTPPLVLAPPPPPSAPPPQQQQQESPRQLQTLKKSRRKCFWFL